jgi:alpha-L-rhamnosidase
VTRDLRFVRAGYEGPGGPIAAEWSRERGVLMLSCRVPVGTVARVAIPCARVEDVTEGARVAKGARGIRTVGHEHGCAVFEVGSGHYEFSAPER